MKRSEGGAGIRKAWRKVAPEPLRRRLAGVRAERRAPLVSIVIPVYGVEEYLDECLRSVLKQSYRKLQVILVDDGSPDRCGEMCDEYRRRDPRVTVLHQVNGGLSNARNNGAEMASGKYLMFVDSDDVLAPGAIKRLVETLEQTGSEIATGNVDRFRGSRSWRGWNQAFSHVQENYWSGDGHRPDRVTTDISETPELLFDTTSWNKMFVRRFFQRNAIRFPEGKLYEDMLPMAQAYSVAKQIDIVFACVYRYREREDQSSITQKRGEVRNLADKVEMMDRVLGLFASRGDDACDVLIRKALEGDLHVYAPFLGVDAEFDAIYHDAVGRYWAMAKPEIVSQIPLPVRLLLGWQAANHYERAQLAQSWAKEKFFEIPIIDDEGVLAFDPSYSEYLSVVREAKSRDIERYVKVAHDIQHCVITDNLLGLSGYAYLDGIPARCPQAVRLEFRSGAGDVLPVPHEHEENQLANTRWGSSNTDYSAYGFRVQADLGKLFGDTRRSSAVEWALWIVVDAGGYTRAVPATSVWRGGPIRTRAVGEVGDHRVARLKWDPWYLPLRMIVGPIEVGVADAKLVDSRVSFALAVLGAGPSSIASVAAIRGWDKFRVAGSIAEHDEQHLLVDFDLATVPNRYGAGARPNDWGFELTTKDGSRMLVSENGQEQAFELGWPWSFRMASNGQLRLLDRSTVLEVEDIQYSNGAWCFTGRNPEWSGTNFELIAWNREGECIKAAFEIDAEGTFVFEIPLKRTTWFGSEASQPVGEYRFWLRADGRTHRCRIRASLGMVDSFPLTATDELFETRVHAPSDDLEIQFGVFPALCR